MCTERTKHGNEAGTIKLHLNPALDHISGQHELACKHTCVCALQVVVMALIIGSLFNGQRPTAAAARNYFGVSFLSMMFLSMGAMPEMGITFANKPCAPPLPSKCPLPLPYCGTFDQFQTAHVKGTGKVRIKCCKLHMVCLQSSRYAQMFSSYSRPMCTFKMLPLQSECALQHL